MIDARLIRENAGYIKTILKNRNMEHVADIDKFAKIDEERRDIIAKTDKLRERRNKASKEVGKRRANSSWWQSPALANGICPARCSRTLRYNALLQLQTYQGET